MEAFDKLGLDVASMLLPWIAILISISAAFWFKDFATNFMQGLKFRFNPAFNEGDEVLLDGEQSIIVKIEWTTYEDFTGGILCKKNCS